MADAVPRMSLIITKLLYEKGLEIPVNNQHNVSASMSRARSRASMLSSGRASECSLTINSREDDGIISRSLYRIKFQFFLSHHIFTSKIVLFITPSQTLFLFLLRFTYSFGAVVCKLIVECIKNIIHEIKEVRKGGDDTNLFIIEFSN